MKGTKILAISDTHGQIYLAEDMIEKYQNEGVTAVIHCGDHIDDARRLEKKFPDLTFYAVPGNCDLSGGAERDLVVEIEDSVVLITHGDRHGVNYDYEELYIDAEAYGASLVVFGHTHRVCREQKEGVQLLNPGSITQPRDTMYPSFAIIEVMPQDIIHTHAAQIQSMDNVVPHPLG